MRIWIGGGQAAHLFVVTVAMNVACAGALAAALPAQGRFVTGQGTISRGGRALTVDQATSTGIVDWKSFSIGVRDGVTFDNGRGATLNVVNGGDISRIAGDLHATGSVYLLNRAGVAITSTGRVDTQGNFAASSLYADRDAFSADGRLHLSGHSRGNVVDAGRIAARNVALIAGGTVRTPGQVAAAGRVETSGARVRIAGADIVARRWLIDPKNLTVNGPAATSIEKSLDNGTNIMLETTATGASGPGTKTSGPGDIVIAAPIAWTGTAALTLDAFHGVNIEKQITVDNAGRLVIDTANGGILQFTDPGNVTFHVRGAHLKINGAAYKLEDTIGQLAAAISSAPSGHFALAENFDASVLGTLTQSPITTIFAGTLEGLGHSISNLTIDASTQDYVGLFEDIDTGGTVSDLQMAHAHIEGGVAIGSEGALAGFNAGTVSNDSSSGVLSGQEQTHVGGLVGFDTGTIEDSKSSATVTAGAQSFAGGLVGTVSSGTVTGSHASGAVTDNAFNANAGGLVGAALGDILDSFATGKVSATGTASDGGGLAGSSTSGISGSRASGSVKGGALGSYGGLVGSDSGSIDTSHATGAVTTGAGDYSGGLAGYMTGETETSFATGDVTTTGDGYAGGLVGFAEESVLRSYATGDVLTGDANLSGGLVGEGALVSRSYALGKVTGGADSEVGGLAGETTGNVVWSHAKGRVMGGDHSQIGGLSGQTLGVVTSSYATGHVSGGEKSMVGGLVGQSEAAIGSSHASGVVTDNRTNADVGGLVGESDSSIGSSYADGAVQGSGIAADVGGLAGISKGAIAGSHATGQVTAGAINVVAGGLVGLSTAAGSVSQSYATGDVLGGSAAAESKVGGLIGLSDGTVSQSFATGMVTAGDIASVGGLLGWSEGAVSEAYALGAVSAGDDSVAGGLIGTNKANVDQVYSTGTVTAGLASEVGGLIGDAALGTITNAYWDRTTSGIHDPSRGAGSAANVPGITGLTDATLKAALPGGFNPTDWSRSAGINKSRPYLTAVPPP